MAETTGWGILATGKIAAASRGDLREVPGARLAAVGLAYAGLAPQAFAEEYGGPDCHAHSSYADLVADPSVDVVYVATPHAMHLEQRPDGARGRQARALREAADHQHRRGRGDDRGSPREHDRFLMEAMWMACHPVIRGVRDGFAAGRFGTPRVVHAEIGFVVDRPPSDRLLDPGLGGGALLDMGVYPLTFADLILGPATELRGSATLNDSGIDTDVAIAGRHAGGSVSALTATISSYSAVTATVATDTGRVDVASGFFNPPGATWVPHDGEPEEVRGVEPLLGKGLGNEAAEVQRCLAAGLRESPLIPHEQTLRIMRQMDDLRRQIGLVYPGEQD